MPREVKVILLDELDSTISDYDAVLADDLARILERFSIRVLRVESVEVVEAAHGIPVAAK